MTNDDLIRDLHSKLGSKHTLKELTVLVDEVLSILSERLSKGEEIQLADFGTFSVASKTIRPISKRSA